MKTRDWLKLGAAIGVVAAFAVMLWPVTLIIVCFGLLWWAANHILDVIERHR